MPEESRQHFAPGGRTNTVLVAKKDVGTSCSFLETAGWFLGTSSSFPETSDWFPETSDSSLETNDWSLETSNWFPEMSGSSPNLPKKFLVLRRVFADEWTKYPTLPELFEPHLP
jgi:hypothetical protein